MAKLAPRPRGLFLYLLFFLSLLFLLLLLFFLLFSSKMEEGR
jgi:hypothetical protein